MNKRLTGCGTAIVTPFTKDGALDEGALRRLVDWQIEQGIHFLVPCGSTGEAVTMTAAEHRRVVEITVEQAKGRVPIVAGAASNDTVKAIALSKEMKACGATHLLQTSPWYNKPPQRGIIEHYKRVADATDLPIVVYNVPGRTGSNIEAKTTVALAQIPNIVAVKEASGNLGQVLDILRDRPDHLSVLSGDDELTLPIMVAGGDGIVSVVSNATPKAMSQLAECALRGDFAAARKLHFQLLPWMRAAFVESNPIPVKAAMAMLGRMENRLRLPLVPLADAHVETVRSALKAAGALA
ncbi:MAG TPA: 4-hydroxy-tetrahydrodipicolinate synthase [Gemmatimonadaceae bacterium]|nr:4-hydroxy-tetrahydrodipicolinate synthase [Gemmatimonadaceae bacterium]